MKCEHDKSYAPYVLTSNPPQVVWICRKCGEEGRETSTAMPNDYEKVKKRFKK